MDYQVKRNDGKLISYKLVGHSVIPVEVTIHENGLIADFHFNADFNYQIIKKYNEYN